MKTWTAPLLALVATSGCIVHSHDRYEEPGTVIIVEDNRGPLVHDAYAGVFWDDYYFDDVWTFEAQVDDPDGPYDVIGVWADVYDEYRGGVLVESFELYPTNDPYFWASDWMGSTTYLDPFYDGYTVDIVAYDSYEDFDWVTVWADTY
jgi:hypothetical protein